MLDIDFGPGVLFGYVFCGAFFPIMFSFIVDKYWKDHRDDPAWAKADGFN